MLPIPASSVACERLFSGSKQTATDRRARLGAERFEELQLLKSAWRRTIVDVARSNSLEEEVVMDDMGVYTELLAEDTAIASWDKNLNEIITF